ncbi:cold-shock protein [Lewinella sp. JB7]|uniref:cold-shock protein n=1 Tax=Lewinella sp. JB7 TaxID=2962887 RepID=UPI0020C9EB4C|nr:cold shock domain-containing protein [Lewinella sp. JB7]MCP9236867.1 cold shock domain-containing protein [Lewinella sp. JB7]
MQVPSIGTIAFYLPDRGYGYLRLRDTREEFHFRKRNLRTATVQKGDLVRFVLREGPGGYYADEIEPAAVA